MSVTINQQPGTGASAHSPLYVHATSTNAGSTGFRYVFNVYVNTVLVHVAKVAPYPSGNVGVLDVAPIVRSFITTSYLFPDGGQLVATNTSLLKRSVRVDVGEQIGTATPSNFATGTSFFAWNAYRLALPGSDTNPITGFVKKRITERPTSLDYPAIGANNQAFFFSFLNQSATAIRLVLSARTKADTQVATYTIDLNVTTYPNDLVVLNLSYPILTALCAGLDAYIASSEHGAIRIGITSAVGTGGAIVSDPFYLTYGCPGTHKTLHFLNRLGGYDSMSFVGINRMAASIDAKTFTRSNAFISSGVSEYNSTSLQYNQSTIRYSTEIETTYKLQSHYLSEGEYNWLRQLLQSPDIYFEEGGYYYPCIIKTKDWLEKKQRNDKMFQLEIEVMIDRNSNAQYR